MSKLHTERFTVELIITVLLNERTPLICARLWARLARCSPQGRVGWYDSNQQIASRLIDLNQRRRRKHERGVPVNRTPVGLNRFAVAILTVCYAAGLRISEAVRLTLPAIDS